MNGKETLWDTLMLPQFFTELGMIFSGANREVTLLHLQNCIPPAQRKSPKEASESTHEAALRSKFRCKIGENKSKRMTQDMQAAPMDSTNSRNTIMQYHKLRYYCQKQIEGNHDKFCN